MNIQQQLRTHPVAFGSLAILVITLALSVWRSSALADLRSELVEKEREGAQASENARAAQRLDTQLEQIAELNKQATDRAIDPNDVASNQQYFYSFEAESGVKITDLRRVPPAVTGKKPSAAAAKTVPFSVGAQGDFRSIVRFIRAIESGPRLIRISSVAIGASAATPGAGGRATQSPLTLSLQVEFLSKS